MSRLGARAGKASITWTVTQPRATPTDSGYGLTQHSKLSVLFMPCVALCNARQREPLLYQIKTVQRVLINDINSQTA